MNSYDDLVKSISFKFNDRIKSACIKLFDCFNLNHFYYYKISNLGGFSFFDSNASWGEYFSAEKLYLGYRYLRHPKYFQDSILLLNSSNVEDENVRKIYDSGREKFDFMTDLKVINRMSDGFEAYGFSSNTSNENQVSLLLSELPMLRLFVKWLKVDNRFLFSKLEDSQISLVELIGDSFYNNPFSNKSQVISKQALLQKMGIEGGESLTTRESEVIRLVLQGYSAGRVASQLYLSKRTVEHHIERIKQKLRCESKAELIQKARELEILGVV